MPCLITTRSAIENIKRRKQQQKKQKQISWQISYLILKTHDYIIYDITYDDI